MTYIDPDTGEEWTEDQRSEWPWLVGLCIMSVMILAGFSLGIIKIVMTLTS